MRDPKKYNLGAYFPRVNAIQVGTVFAKIESEESDVVKRRYKGYSQYLLPINLSNLSFRADTQHIG